MSTPVWLAVFAGVFLFCGAASPQRQMLPLGVAFAVFFGVGAFWTALAGVA